MKKKPVIIVATDHVPSNQTDVHVPLISITSNPTENHVGPITIVGQPKPIIHLLISRPDWKKSEAV
jgi:hypothetical protein